MRTQLFSMFAVTVLLSAPVMADEPIELSAQQMDQITAGTLGLPNGKTALDSFDTPAPNVNGYLGVCDEATGAFCHPAITRRSLAAFATAGHVPSANPPGVSDGPWASTDAAGGPLVFVCDVCGP